MVGMSASFILDEFAEMGECYFEVFGLVTDVTHHASAIDSSVTHEVDTSLCRPINLSHAINFSIDSVDFALNKNVSVEEEGVVLLLLFCEHFLLLLLLLSLAIGH